MIVTPTYSREMGEGGRLVPPARVPTLGLPDPNPSPTYKSDVGGGVFKAGGMGGAYDLNKNSLNDKEGVSGGSLGGLPLSHHLQPFTAPWLAEVAHITPARPTDHLPYPQPPTPTLPDYYPHYPGLPHRPTGYYPHHFLPPGAASHFLREYPRHAHRPYPPLDPRPPLERPTPVSGAPTLVRPLGPPPLRGMHPDTHRDHLREVAPQNKMRPRPPDLTLPTSPSGTSGEPSPRGPHGEPSPKRRPGSSAFPMPAPRSPRAAPRGHPAPAVPGPTTPVSAPPATGPVVSGPPASCPPVSGPTSSGPPPVCSPSSRPSVSGPILAAPVPIPTSAAPPPEDPRPPSPYHAHFARGALVTVGAGVRRVEELETRDFLEAAKAAEDLMLDPSTVAAITTRPGASTITFTFPSRNTQVSVEASLDHPFFVFHSGWSSCSPELTQKKYDLKVRQLQVGDICVSLTKKAPDAEPTNPMPPPPTSTSQVPSPSAELSSHASASTSGVSTPPIQSSTSVKKESTSLPFLGGSSSSSVWSKPAALRTTERQHSSDEAQREEKDSGRKRRWSDPGQAT
ncbi:MAGE-like protein 2 [Homarus americanus]|nr:MAGE-like protein 2 [Homarus americanus]